MASTHTANTGIETIGSGAVTAPFYEVEHSEVIIVIGANPTENHPVAATFFKNAAKNGSKLIVMDPRGQALKRYATHMLQFKPGADVALLNSIMYVIIQENLFNNEYIKKSTLGFDDLKKQEIFSNFSIFLFCFTISPAMFLKTSSSGVSLVLESLIL